jgi:integrase
MASLRQQSNKTWRLQFVSPDRRHLTLYLGKLPKKSAETIKSHVEAILSAILSQSPLDSHTASWLGSLPPQLHAKLVKAGLALPRIGEAPPPSAGLTLQVFVDDYLEKRRPEVKPRSFLTMRLDADSLIMFLGSGKLLADVTAGDARDFKAWLRNPESRPKKKKGHAQATIGRRLCRCKEFFEAAVDDELITRNPFRKVKKPPQKNEARFRFVTREETEQLIAACPDGQWRLIVALSRYGGLRCPSETLSLTWADVDWDKGRVHVRSPKTEHHEDKASRIIPLFPELRRHLEEAFDQAEEGTTHVVTRYRNIDGEFTNLGSTFVTIVKRAGLVPWPRLFHNLRASRQNELAESFPIHLVCAWIGNSALIAKDHYLHVREEDFAKALQEATHKTTHTPTDSSVFDRIPAPADCEKALVFQENRGEGPTLLDAKRC